MIITAAITFLFLLTVVSVNNEETNEIVPLVVEGDEARSSLKQLLQSIISYFGMRTWIKPQNTRPFSLKICLLTVYPGMCRSGMNCSTTDQYLPRKSKHN